MKEFRIFNRWGAKIFSTAEKNKGWDGKLNGRLQDPGVYIWVIIVIDTRGKIIEKKEAVTLVR